MRNDTIGDVNDDTKCRRVDASTTFRAKHHNLLQHDEPLCWSRKERSRKKRSIFSDDISALEDVSVEVHRSSSRDVTIYDRD